MSERRPTTRAAKHCMEWINTCKMLGWPKSTIPRLVDLWWEYHDDDGLLIEMTPAGKSAADDVDWSLPRCECSGGMCLLTPPEGRRCRAKGELDTVSPIV